MKEGAIETAGNVTSAGLQAGINGMVEPSRTGVWNPYAQDMFTSMTGALVSQALYTGAGIDHSINWDSMAGDSWGILTKEYMGAREERNRQAAAKQMAMNNGVDADMYAHAMEYEAAQRAAEAARKDPLEGRQSQTDGAGYGLFKQEELNAYLAAFGGYQGADFGKYNVSPMTSGEYQAMLQYMGVDMTQSTQTFDPYAIDIAHERSTIIATNGVAESIRNASHNGEGMQSTFWISQMEKDNSKYSISNMLGQKTSIRMMDDSIGYEVTGPDGKVSTYQLGSGIVMNNHLSPQDAMEYTNKVFDMLNKTAIDAGLAGEEKLKFMYNEANSFFSGMNFENQKQLNYTLAGVMQNIGTYFNVHDNTDGLPYGFQPQFDESGNFMGVSQVDCVCTVNLGINILGMTNPKAMNAYEYRPDAYSYEDGIEAAVRKHDVSESRDVLQQLPEGHVIYGNNKSIYNGQMEYTGGVTNMFYNRSLFGVTSAGEKIDDYTGLFGITVGDEDDRVRTVVEQNYNSGTYSTFEINDAGILNHIYAVLDKQGTITVESTSFNDVNEGESMNGIRYYRAGWYNRNHTQYYLQLKLNNSRKIK